MCFNEQQIFFFFKKTLDSLLICQLFSHSFPLKASERLNFCNWTEITIFIIERMERITVFVLRSPTISERVKYFHCLRQVHNVLLRKAGYKKSRNVIQQSAWEKMLKRKVEKRSKQAQRAFTDRSKLGFSENPYQDFRTRVYQ